MSFSIKFHGVILLRSGKDPDPTLVLLPNATSAPTHLDGTVATPHYPRSRGLSAVPQNLLGKILCAGTRASGSNGTKHPARKPGGSRPCGIDAIADDLVLTYADPTDSSGRCATRIELHGGTLTEDPLPGLTGVHWLFGTSLRRRPTPHFDPAAIVTWTSDPSDHALTVDGTSVTVPSGTAIEIGNMPQQDPADWPHHHHEVCEPFLVDTHFKHLFLLYEPNGMKWEDRLKGSNGLRPLPVPGAGPLPLRNCSGVAKAGGAQPQGAPGPIGTMAMSVTPCFGGEG